jgi:hypothetical protein
VPANLPGGSPTYIQRRAIRYRPQTSAMSTIAQSTATNQKGIAVRPPSSLFAFGCNEIVTQKGPLVTQGHQAWRMPISANQSSMSFALTAF